MVVRERMLAVALAATLVAGVSGCGGDDDGDPDAGQPTTPAAAPSTTAPAGPSPTPTPAEEPVELFEFEITDGQADPPLQRATVAHGATVRIVVSGDQPDELHLHGYDLSAELAPGQPAVLEFEADQTGQFELETHDSHLVLLQLLVR